MMHSRTQGMYLADSVNRTLVYSGKSYVVTPYIPVPNNESVLYLREPDDFVGFGMVCGAVNCHVLSADKYTTVKFKLDGQWVDVAGNAVS
ncbi:hypothetical protein OTK49_01190 [Vibrio coralliirubri]|uniref:hypothetical protein n=1 Tax=Vibrio coralliirubri TaxID=1516159 RepID=UPI0022837C00|nr:hypothetical protein [Vibrio coralliirubri]MCY9861144.1 hypothetical protein [Vibrio coralliirubri]